MPEATLEAPGQQEADISIPKPIADEKLAATGSKVAAGGPRPKLPEQFQKGVAISMFQNSGGINSNWGRYAEARGKLFGLIPNIMDKSSPNDGACDFWDRCVSVCGYPWRVTMRNGPDHPLSARLHLVLRCMPCCVRCT